MRYPEPEGHGTLYWWYWPDRHGDDLPTWARVVIERGPTDFSRVYFSPRMMDRLYQIGDSWACIWRHNFDSGVLRGVLSSDSEEDAYKFLDRLEIMMALEDAGQDE